MEDGVNSKGWSSALSRIRRVPIVNKDYLRIDTICLLFFILAIGFIGNCGGGSNGGSGTQSNPTSAGLTPNDIVLAEVTDPESPINIIATTKDGTEGFGVLVDRDAVGNPTEVTGGVYTSKQGAAGILEAGPDGLPTSLTDSSGNKAIFENWTDSTADISILDANGKLIVGPTTVNVDSTKIKEIKDLFGSISFSSGTKSEQIFLSKTDAIFLSNNDVAALKYVSLALSITGCLGAAASVGVTGGITLLVAPLACESALLSVVAFFTNDELLSAGSAAISAAQCALLSPPSCLNMLIKIAIAVNPTPTPTPTQPPLPTPTPTPTQIAFCCPTNEDIGQCALQHGCPPTFNLLSCPPNSCGVSEEGVVCFSPSFSGTPQCP